MQQDRAVLKMNTRRIMRERKKEVYLASIVFLALSIIISMLSLRLSGVTEYVENASRTYMEVYGEILETAETSGAGEAAAKMQDLAKRIEDSLYTWPERTVFSYILSVALFLSSLLLGAGYISHCMLISRGEACSLRDLFNGFARPIRMLALLFLISILTTLGFLLLIIPGFVLLYCYRLSIYVAYDNPELGPVECMRKSRQLTRGRKWELFVLDLSFIGWRLLGSVISNLFLPVLDIWLEPYIGITVAQWYNAASGHVVVMPENTDITE